MSGSARTTTDPSAKTRPTASESASLWSLTGTGSVPASVSEFLRVLLAVLDLLREDILDVGAGLDELVVVCVHRRPAPFVGIPGPGVIGGQGGVLVAVVAVEEVAEVEGSVADA